jgi:hypothetical protein
MHLANMLVHSVVLVIDHQNIYRNRSRHIFLSMSVVLVVYIFFISYTKR